MNRRAAFMLTYRTANRGRAMERRVGRQSVLRTFVGALALIGVAATSALGQGLPRAEKPEDVGLSSVRLARLTDRIETGVQKGELPGAVIVLARRGRVAYFETFGLRDPETRAPMTSDAIFRIASMTKPFTSLARPEAKVAPETEAAPAPASMAGTPEVNAN
jgi:CubicO group peptidase (beta-lactamase class C family)